MSRPRTAFLIVCLLCTACAATPPNSKGNRPHSSDFKLDSIAKTDIDMVTEIHQQAALSHLHTLMEKLYRRNPREWKKGGHSSMEAAMAQMVDHHNEWHFAALNGRSGTDSIHLALQEDFTGDRVQAFIGGLAKMIIASYNDKTQFFVLDELDPQKLYNSARNVEVAVWQLGNARDTRGELLLLSNDADATVRNLSFEREFGKVIAEQDTLAQIIAEKTNRSIVRVIQTMASAVFLPI
jgi:hypothetical protein